MVFYLAIWISGFAIGVAVHDALARRSPVQGEP
jgi:hypothetical protein